MFCQEKLSIFTILFFVFLDNAKRRLYITFEKNMLTIFFLFSCFDPFQSLGIDDGG